MLYKKTIVNWVLAKISSMNDVDDKHDKPIK